MLSESTATRACGTCNPVFQSAAGARQELFMASKGSLGRSVPFLQSFSPSISTTECLVLVETQRNTLAGFTYKTGHLTTRLTPVPGAARY